MKQLKVRNSVCLSMRKKLISIALFLYIGTWSIASAQDRSRYAKKEFIASNGIRLPYRLLYPEAPASGKLPLVLVLHGGGERGNDNEKQLTHGADLFIDPTTRKNFPAYVLFPQCPGDTYWASATIDRSTNPFKIELDYSKPIPEGLEATVELVRRLIKTEKIDKKRIYITGLSMGAMGTFEAVHRYPKIWAAALPICGMADATAYNARAKKIPFWLFHGDADAVVSVSGSRDMVAKLKSLGYTVTYTEYPGVNHNSWDHAFKEANYLTWMFSQKR